ncbi:MAG: glycosyltransferase family 4 protein, partial [Eubacterium sp.]
NVLIKRMHYLQFNRKGKLGRLINYFSFIVTASTHVFLLRHYKSIIVYSNPPILPIVPVIANILFKIKIVFVCYDIYPDLALLFGNIHQGSLIEKITNKINIALFKRASRIVALSSEMKAYLIENKKYLNEKNVAVIPNWYEEQNEDECVYNLDIQALKKSGKTIIVYSGNMGICQDMDTIIKAVIQLKENADILFIFAGHGTKQGDLKDKATKENLRNILFLDFLQGSNFTDVLKIADCHVVSLEKDVEALSVPSKTYSYMAIGRPIIAIMDSKTDIVKDLIQSNAGFQVQQGDVDQLVSVILELHANKDKVKTMGKNSQKLFQEKYTRQICTQKYYSLMQEVLIEGEKVKNV